MTEPQSESTRTEELRSFAFLAVVMAPILAVVLIASYGFAIWFYQMIIGGPPHA
ncbi:periplasmic nitrate reductase, NapE protein [Comamonas thiooxydans]|uniref:periplasmic nitrate reductase, NapE protein n=1 Tax=Comamonas thiooxydans TaxID=363952 RepID=UPI0001BB113C|nr:periplasmic nitrate reductase, NapE protein [Comamonas thiooxydans]ACY32766.1 Putative periplasmic nitrate reductase NapE [Comamonas thiooxydans]MDO1475495.1 periplasmic nitrate reductase, NapE protein [Comamonas thiooxydans]